MRALRNEFIKNTEEMVNRAKRLNCYRDNSGASAYSGCAMDVVGPFFPFWADRVRVRGLHRLSQGRLVHIQRYQK